MTSHWCDFQNTDYILHCGSNSVENHPVSSKWLNRAHERGATWIVVDPRYTRTAEMADIYCPIRSGTDIAFYGGMYHYIIENLIEPGLAEHANASLDKVTNSDTYNYQYLIHYTNASYLLLDDYEFSEEDGLFNGFDDEHNIYTSEAKHAWHYQVEEEVPWDTSAGGAYAWAVADGVPKWDIQPYERPKRDNSLQNPRCVYQVFKEHYSRYDLDTVASICGMDRATLELVYRTYAQSAAPGKSGMVLYALGQTQHTYGAQNTRAMSVMQLLCGNIGVPGGGVNALRGEPNVQGATDMGMMVNEHPAYLKWANTTSRSSLAGWLEDQVYSAGYYSNKPKFIVSSLKEWFGENATYENDYGYDWWPKVPSAPGDQDWTHISTFELMSQGVIKGYFNWGMNPCHSAPNAGNVRRSMANLDWLVVVDQVETESAGFWHAPDMNPEEIDTTVYFLPCALIYEKPGTIANSGRWLQWRYQAVEPWDEAKPDLEICDLLWKEITRLYTEEAADPATANPDPILKTKWDYYLDGKISVYPVCWALNGYRPASSDWSQLASGEAGALARGSVDLLSGYSEMAADGSTACAMWIYSGFFNNAEAPVDAAQQPIGRRNTVDTSGLGLNSEWAFSWPSNRRILYNRASADPQGRPWSEDKRLVEWDGAQWLVGYENGLDIGDFVVSTTDAKGNTVAVEPNDNAFFMTWEQNARIFSYAMEDGPLPEFYEPFETTQGANHLNGSLNNPCIMFTEYGSTAHGSGEEYPIIATTYSVTEHWQTGGQTRSCPVLLEAMPTQFVEMSYELAGELGVESGDSVRVYNNRGSVTVAALVTHRFKPLTVQGETVHEVGITHHFGWTHLYGTGETVNDLTPNVGDPNTMVPEYKAFLVNIEKA